jgi:Flp pilus assembly protein TadD
MPLATLQEAIKRFPKDLEPRRLLSHVCLQEGRDWDAAERALQDVLTLAPDDVKARRNMAVLRYQRRNGSAAAGKAPSAKANGQ